MPADYTYKTKERTGTAYTQTGLRQTSRSAVRTVDLLFDQTATNPEDLNAQECYARLSPLNLFGQIGKSMFVDGVTWRDGTVTDWHFAPWLLLDNVQWERDPQNRHLFHGRYEYATPGSLEINSYDGDEFDALMPVPSNIDGYPWLRRRFWRPDDQILWGEAKSSGHTELKLPTGNFFPEPFRRTYPTKTYVQFQFEMAYENIEDVIEDRLFAINLDTFEGNTPDATEVASGRDEGGWTVPPRWMITDIQYQPVNGLFQTAPGDALSKAPIVLMIYTIEYTVRDGGWLDRRALVDRHYLTAPNNYATKAAYTEPDTGNITVIDCLLNKDGTFKTNQNGPPTFTDFLTQPQIGFSFLKQTPVGP